MAETSKVKTPVKPKDAKTGVKPGQKATGTKTGAPAAAAFRMESMQRREKYLKLLIYGNYGTGKTTLAATSAEVPQMQNVFMINAEAGDLSLDEGVVPHVENIMGVTVTNFKMVGQVHQYLMKHCQLRDANDIEGLKAQQAAFTGVPVEEIDEPVIFKTVFVDSLTEVEAYAFNQLLGVRADSRIDMEGEVAEFKEYKQNNGMMLRCVRAFRDLPMHVIFICAEQFTQDETKRMKFSPNMTGKLSKTIQGFMDMVGYLEVGKDDQGKPLRRLSVTPGNKFDAKHRYAKFKGSHFDNPTLLKILQQVGLLDEAGSALK